MNKIVSIALILSFVMLASSIALPANAAPPAIPRPMEMVELTIQGGDVATVDPAVCYDTASAELIMNVYETLITFDGEHMDRYLGAGATEWSAVQHDPPTVDPLSGMKWYYTYYFKIRTGIPWQDSTFGTMTPEDVEYSIERGLVVDQDYGPQWMYYEPLLNGATHNYVNGTAYDTENVSADAIFVGKCIDSAIESNSTHVWFNLAFQGAYAPMYQILCQSWASILSKDWLNSLGRTNWDGTWGDYTGWVEFANPTTAPLDDPTPIAMGCGPFTLANLDRALMYWDANRFTNYWRGWGSGPAPAYGVGWPAFGGSKPAGYIDHFKVSWAYDWTNRLQKYINGEADFLAVPRANMGEILALDNTRCIYPLPSLAGDLLAYNYVLTPTTPYQTVFENGVLGESGVPADFFGNTQFGKAMRQAFSYSIDYDTIIATALLNEGMHPSTGVLPTLRYYDNSIKGYTYNLTKATELFKTWPGLWDTGFTLKIWYNTNNNPRKVTCETLSNAINSLNPKFHVSANVLGWGSLLTAGRNHQVGAFCIGWLADYPDIHNFVYAYYYTYGTYPGYQSYSSAAMDALVLEGIATPDGQPRQDVYTELQQLAIEECPSASLYTGLGRHFEHTYQCGWYYNPIYSGTYAANLWKAYYTPFAQLDALPPSVGNLLPYDVNYDGKTNMVDIGTTAASFGAIYGPPMGTKWVYRADFNNDRKIDMKDIGGVAKNFGKTTTAWTPTV
jgi:peptide/nickel transport system substrate-binding protein